MKPFSEYLLTESPANDAAKRLGLQYYGFGRYGSNGKVTHHNEFGRLVKVAETYSKNKGEGALSHLEHVEDQVFNHGSHGAVMAMDMLHGVHGLMHGHDERVKITQKIDGCIHENSLLVTDQGILSISEVVSMIQSDKQISVLGYDFETKLSTMTNVTNAVKSIGDKRWVTIEFENGDHSLTCTEDHEIHTTNRGWVKAGELTVEDDITEGKCSSMKVTSILRLNQKFEQYDITTETENFFVRVGTTNVLIHNSPSIVYGRDEQGPFVATKSAFNVNPKVNRTPEDIDANHGHAPGLVSKLKSALEHLPKIHPENGIKQGDLLYTKEMLKIRKIKGVDHIVFKPNTITYAVPLDSEDGRKIMRSKIGVATHTKYVGEGGAGRFPSEAGDTKEDPDVFQMSVDAPKADLDKQIYSGIQKVGAHVQSTPKAHFDFISDPANATMLKQYVNNRVSKGERGVGNADDFLQWLYAYKTKDVDKAKSEKGKATKALARDAELAKMMDNKDAIQKGFDIHHSIQSIKHGIVDTLNKSQKFGHYLSDEQGNLRPTNPEGYVVIGNKGSHKLVNRDEFAHANFNQPKTWGDKK